MKAEEKELLLEELAELEHRQWAHWTKYMLAHVSPENVKRWVGQCATPYVELSEDEKEADRTWARIVLAVLDWKIYHAKREAMEKVFDAVTKIIDNPRRNHQPFELQKLRDKMLPDSLTEKKGDVFRAPI